MAKYKEYKPDTLDDVPVLDDNQEALYKSETPLAPMGGDENTENLSSNSKQYVYPAASNLKSANFVTGSSGWQIKGDGTAEFQSITAALGDFGGWTIIDGYIYSLQSGTPTSSPNDGLVLASGNEGVIVYENTEKRVEVGYLSAGVYGLKVYDDDGTTVLFEASDTQKLMSGVPIQNIASGTDLAIQGWQYDGAFEAVDHDSIKWASGTLRLLDGTTYSITGVQIGISGTGTNAYIYFDSAASTTAFQSTTTAACLLYTSPSPRD